MAYKEGSEVQAKQTCMGSLSQLLSSDSALWTDTISVGGNSCVNQDETLRTLHDERNQRGGKTHINKLFALGPVLL